MDLKPLLTTAIEAATSASREIMAVYNAADFQAEVKGDNSPLTLADKRAHEKISEMLAPSNLPLLSEEGADVAFAQRRGWEYFWMVDPLDGTKEFIKRNGEFTVNIALIHNGAPVLGVVAVPVTGEVFYAAKGFGAWLKKNGQEVPLKKRTPVKLDQPGLRVVASRSHMNEETQNFIDKLKNPVLVSKGSSLKFMLVAEGHADLYPRYAPTMEWDTAAAHAVVLETGAQVLQAGTNEALTYNKENLLNPFFLVL